MSRPIICINALRTKRLIFAACLRRAGYSCLCFESGLDALLTLSRGQDTPSVVFIAAVLPEPLRDGYKVAHLIHARFHATALVLLSEHSGPLAQWHAHRVGISHLLPKHPNTRDIVALVAHYAQPDEETSSSFLSTGDYYARHHSPPTGVFVGRIYNRHSAYGLHR